MNKLIYTITLVVISFSAFGQNYSTLDEKVGYWNQSSIWTNGNISGSFANATTTINENNSNTEIRGHVIHLGNIALSGNNAILKIASEDTLYIYGNLSVGGKSKLYVESNAVLVVTENMEVTGNSVSNNNGTIVVVQDLKATGSTTFTNNSNIYASSTSGNSIDELNPAPRSSSDLENDHPELWNTFISVQPVKLLSFAGIAQGNAVNLDWVTAFEENFDYFTVERAGADLKFEAVGKVNGSGNTSAEVAYHFTDKNPLQGQAFYRLKATDFDGSMEYHKIISVYFDGYSTSAAKVYPNPVVSHTLTIENSAANSHYVKLLDMSGRSVYSQSIQLGTNEISLPQMIKPGAYLLVLLGDKGEQHQQKIMVL